MTDRELAEGLRAATALEAQARAHWQADPRHEERDAALTVARQVTAVKRSLEQWIAARACRMALEA